jgi:putative Holliday junction resolvase
MGRILAFDFGLVRTGVAATDPLKIIATALETVPTKELLAWLKKYLQSETVEAFVIGIPLNPGGPENPVMPALLDFKSKLSQNYPNIRQYEIDERFTSKIATQTIIQSGIGKMERRDKGRVDRVSAVLILQTWMERNL